jgi:hypothetical protein
MSEAVSSSAPGIGSGASIVASSSHQGGAESIAVEQAGEVVVSAATSLNFTSGATITDGGSGVAEIAIGSSGPSAFTRTTGTVAAGKLTAVANANVVQVSNAGSDTFIQLLDLGVVPTQGQIAVISLAPSSEAGYDILTGGSQSGTAYPVSGPSSIGEANQSIWLTFNTATHEWDPLLATPSQSMQLTSNLNVGEEILAGATIVSGQLLEGGAIRVQATILTTSVGVNATIDLNVTSEGDTQRLFLNAQAAFGSISNIINSFSAPIGGQSLEIINTSQFAVALNNSATGVGQIAIPSYAGQETGAQLVIQPGQLVTLDYDSGNEIGFGATTWVVTGWTGDTRVGLSVINAAGTLTAQHVGDDFIQVSTASSSAPTLLDLGTKPLKNQTVRIANEAGSSATLTLTSGGAQAGTAYPFSDTVALAAGQIATAVFTGSAWAAYH